MSRRANHACSKPTRPLAWCVCAAIALQACREQPAEQRVSPRQPRHASAPEAPRLRGATLLSGGAAGARLRVLGVAAAGTQIELFTSAECAGRALSSGPGSALESPGLDLPLPAGAAKVEVRAVASAAGARSPCSAPLAFELPPAHEADSWRPAGYGSLEAAQAAWSATAKAQAALGQALPQSLREALRRERLAPVAQLMRLRGSGPLPSLDLDADGQRDHALVVLPAGSLLGAALAAALEPAAPAPADADLGPLLAELRRISLDGGSEVALALARPGGFAFTRRPGNGLASIGRWQKPDLCDPGARDAADLEWLAARPADVLEYLVGETASSGFLVWDARRGRVADLPDRCK
jgi:hypothetical protein